MVAINPKWLQQREDRIADLTEAAYRAILERGYHGSFLKLELTLWNTVRQVVEQAPPDTVSTEAA